MDNLVFACVVPHGAQLIPLISGPEGAKVGASRIAMAELGRRMEAARPETIVILETHSMQVDGAFALLDSVRVRGELGAPHLVVPKEAPEHHFSLTFDVDRDLNLAIVTAARRLTTPAVRVRYYLDSTPLAIAWGSLIPLWFLGATHTPPPKVVVTGTNRSLPRKECIEFGRALRTAISVTERRIAVVISTDTAHAHVADSRFGFDPAAAESDAAVVDAVRAGALERLLAFDQDWIDRAKNEAILPLLALHGLLEGLGWRAEVLSYEAPTYFGMMCAAYSRQRGDA